MQVVTFLNDKSVKNMTDHPGVEMWTFWTLGQLEQCRFFRCTQFTSNFTSGFYRIEISISEEMIVAGEIFLRKQIS